MYTKEDLIEGECFVADRVAYLSAYVTGKKINGTENGLCEELLITKDLSNGEVGAVVTYVDKNDEVVSLKSVDLTIEQVAEFNRMLLDCGVE